MMQQATQQGSEDGIIDMETFNQLLEMCVQFQIISLFMSHQPCHLPLEGSMNLAGLSSGHPEDE